MNNKNHNKQVFSFQDQIDFLKDCGIEINDDDDFSSLLDINDEEDYERQEFDLLFLELSAPEKNENYLSSNLFFLDAQPVEIDYAKIFQNLLRISGIKSIILNIKQEVTVDGILLSFNYNDSRCSIYLQNDSFIDATVLNKFSDLFQYELKDKCLFVYNPWIDRTDSHDVVVGCIPEKYINKLIQLLKKKVHVI